VILNYCKQSADIKDSQFIICSDPVGENLTVALKQDHKWVVLESLELSLILMDYYLSFKRQNNDSTKYAVICN
jgi:hypothetical protein